MNGLPLKHTGSRPAATGLDPDQAPRVWILLATGAGDNRQLLNLASALGWPWEIKQAVDSLPRVLADRLRTSGRDRVPHRKGDQLCPPWPDVILMSGGRCVIDAMRIRAESGGRSKVVCLGRPWAPLAWFDLVVSTPQYRLPDHPNVLQTLLPLNRMDPDTGAAAARAWEPRLSHLPRPWLGVLLGGSSGSYRFTTDAARVLGRRVDARARATGSALLISSSARTPGKVLDALLESVQVPYYCYHWHPDDIDNPLEAILALSDEFVVTADSASMLAEACATGRPVMTFVPPLRWRARLLTRSWLPDGAGRAGWLTLRHRLVSRGLWVPARDMSRVHEALAACGAVQPLPATAVPRPVQATPDDMDRVVVSIKALLRS
ncbi:MAG: ELM1/GtrOC1 family putative glycosyltransferase [Gammaproteobacteria bacterium]|nr:ELM1/GtrOC1 family putative glycosyltransferase [Gammaproteobacteria bacterium]